MQECRFNLFTPHICRKFATNTIPRALRWHYSTGPDNSGVGDARANACEIVAWRFLTRLSEREAVEFCLYEIPDPKQKSVFLRDAPDLGESNERTALLPSSSSGEAPGSRPDTLRGASQRRTQLIQSLSKLLTTGRHTYNMALNQYINSQECKQPHPDMR